MGSSKDKMEEFLARESKRFQDKCMEFEEFSSLMKEMATLDERCALPESIIQQLFDFVYVKQSGAVTFDIVIGLVGEIVREQAGGNNNAQAVGSPQSGRKNQNMQFHPQNASQEALWNRINGMVDSITGDTLQQMKYLYEGCLEECYREDRETDIQQGIPMELLSQKINEMPSISEFEKQDIEILFKCIMSDIGTITEVALGELMSLLEQFWIASVQGPTRISLTRSSVMKQQNETEKGSERTSATKIQEDAVGTGEENRRKSDNIQKSNQNSKKSSGSGKSKESTVAGTPSKDTKKTKDDKKTHKRSNSDKDHTNYEGQVSAEQYQYSREDYSQDIVNGVDYLRGIKGQDNRYYEVVSELANSALLVGSKLDSYALAFEEESKFKEEAQENAMRMEQKNAFLESELKRLVATKDSDMNELFAYKEQIEAECDRLANENDTLQMKIKTLEQRLTEQDKQSGQLMKLETQAASASRNLEQLQKKYEKIMKEKIEAEKESDSVFQLFKENEQKLQDLMAEMESKNAQDKKVGDNKATDGQGKRADQANVMESREAERLKKQIEELLAEVQEKRVQLESKEEENTALQSERIQLVRKIDDFSIQSQKEKPLRFASILPRQSYAGRGSMAGRSSFAYQPRQSITGRASISGLRQQQMQFGQFRNSVIDRSLDGTTPKGVGLPSMDLSQQLNSSVDVSQAFQSRQSISQSQVADVNFESFWNQLQGRQSSAAKGQINRDSSSDFGSETASKKSSGSPKYYKNFRAFDENEIYARDYLGLRDNKKIQEIVEKYSDIDNPKEMKCFSDSIYRINNDNERERRIMFVTAYNIFVLHARSFKVVRVISLERIEKITFPNKSAYLCVISIHQEYDYLVETYRRADFNMFLMQIAKERGLKPFDVVFSDDFVIKRRGGAKKSVKLGQFNDGALVDRFQPAFKSAEKVGFMEIRKKSGLSLFSDSWKENFFVLADIGLIAFDSFDKPTDSKPLLFIPVCEALTLKDPSGVDKPFVIKIFYPNSSQDYFLACKSKADQDQWLDSLRKVIYKSINFNARRDIAMKKQYLEPIESIEEQPDES